MPSAVPLPPTGLTATASNQAVQLSWNPQAGVIYFKIYWSLSPTTGFSWIDSRAAAYTTWTKTGLINGATYYFYITAVDGTGESSRSVIVHATPPGSTVPPAAPTGLKAVPGDRKVTLTWNPNTPGTVTYYKIWATEPSTGIPLSWIDSVAAPTTTYVKTGLLNGHTYQFAVSALNGALESAKSASVLAKPTAPTRPATPTGLRAIPGDHTVYLAWNQTTDTSIKYYKIYATDNLTKGFSWLDSAAYPRTSWARKGFINCYRVYYFKISAINVFNLESLLSNWVWVVPNGPCGAP
jgi:predicted phage tail protein